MSKWISVKKGVPKSCEEGAVEVVVNYFHDVNKKNCSLSAAFYMGKFYVLATWSEDGTDSDVIEATHWMPLPLMDKQK